MANVKHENLTESQMKKVVESCLSATEEYFTKLDVRLVSGGYKVIATVYPKDQPEA